MANKNMFKSKNQKTKVPVAKVFNAAGGKAYSRDAESALAQLVLTGCFNNTFYTEGDAQVTKVVELSNQVSAEYLAKLAVYAREKGYMKDMPALVMAILSVRDANYFNKVFDRVIDNGKMIRNFVQIIRSGKAGRSSLGSAPKKAIQRWFVESNSEYLFKNSIGNDPSLADVIQLTHPKAESKEKNALFCYILGKQYVKKDLPKIVREYEAFKAGDSTVTPDVPFQMLSSLTLSEKNWKDIAENGGFHMVRMNLNTFARHNVFSNKSVTKNIIKTLSDIGQIKNSKVFPYQLMAAFINADVNVPDEVKNALQEAMEIVTESIPRFNTKTYICVDTSGSMSSPITGYRKGSTTKVQCVDVASLIAVSIMRHNRQAEVLPFDTSVHQHNLNKYDSIMTNAKKLASYGGGGTDCGVALKKLNSQKATGDLVIFVSDNESWMGSNDYCTSMQLQWANYRKRNPNAKLVCVDLCANETVQVLDDKNTINIGGWSDSMFDVIARFYNGTMEGDWAKLIQETKV